VCMEGGHGMEEWLQLFYNFFNLGTEDSSGIAIKRDMEPIPFLALYGKSCRVAEVRGARSVLPRLCDYIDHEVPGSRLTCVRQRARDRLLCFVRDSENRRQPCGGDSGQPGNIASVQRGTMPSGGVRRFLNNCLRCVEGVGGLRQ